MWNSPSQAIEKVQEYVNKHQPDTFRLVVNTNPDLIRNDEDWWYVVVQPDRDGVRAHEYAERLSDIEEIIFEKENVHVLLVPTLAD